MLLNPPNSFFSTVVPFRPNSTAHTELTKQLCLAPEFLTLVLPLCFVSLGISQVLFVVWDLILVDWKSWWEAG